MSINSPAMSLSKATECVSRLDLDPIRFKLVHNDEGAKWPLDRANNVENQYRAYLALTLMFPTVSLVPSGDIDAFWHQHILDTEKYAQDCDAVFGTFLHHFPYFGIRSDADAKSLEQAFSATKQLFEEHFDLDITRSTDCTSGTCGTACGQKCSDPRNVLQATLRPGMTISGSTYLKHSGLENGTIQ